MNRIEFQKETSVEKSHGLDEDAKKTHRLKQSSVKCFKGQIRSTKSYLTFFCEAFRQLFDLSEEVCPIRTLNYGAVRTDADTAQPANLHFNDFKSFCKAPAFLSKQDYASAS